MPAKIKIEELIEAFTDPRMIQAITAAMMPAVKLYMDKQIEELCTAVKLVKADNVTQKSAIKELYAENASLRTRLDIMDADARLSSLVIRGVPENTLAEKTSGGAPRDITSNRLLDLNRHVRATEAAVVELCTKDLGIKLSGEDIEQAYRMKSSKPDSPRPILVSFTSRKLRNEIFDQRRKLKSRDDAKIFICENLTKSTSELFFEARKLVKAKRLNSSWTMGGSVYVKRLELDKPTLVRDIASLQAAC